MRVPPGLTEEEVLDAIERVVGVLAKNMAFGPFEVCDIAQQGRLEAIKVLNRGGYDPSRPLANFLYTHVKRRLHNFYRDNCRRNDPPCLICHSCQKLPTEHADGQICRRYKEWRARNDRKMMLLGVPDAEHVAEPVNHRGEGTDEVDLQEILRGIDERLPVELRADYLRMRAGEPISRVRREEVEGAVRDILRELGVEGEGA